uniref:Lipopolysaccharide choline n=1 Tax=Echinococcus granulosus TaxID=6210 RepID=A0A068WFH5_ECHGR|nr:lipopolysaccharide choline [Echinococcus granulosus]
MLPCICLKATHKAVEVRRNKGIFFSFTLIVFILSMLPFAVQESVVTGILLTCNVVLFGSLWYYGPFQRIPLCKDVKIFGGSKYLTTRGVLRKASLHSGPPSLTQIPWPLPDSAPSPNPNSLYRSKFFEPRMTATQRGMLLKFITLFAEIMRKSNLEDKWFISSCTLLGSLRHHGFIPWDDEADVLVDIKYREFIQDSIKKHSNKGYLIAPSGYRDKLYMSILPASMNDVDAEGSREIPRKNYGWPYLDICYYKIDGEYLFELEKYNLQRYVYHVEDIFPLMYRPFGEMWLPAPFKAVKLLMDMYPRNVDCIYNGYSHLAEWRRRRAIASCDTLTNRYAFVRRCPVRIAAIDSASEDLAFVVGQMINRTDNGSYSVIHEITTLVHSTERFSHFDPLTV